VSAGAGSTTAGAAPVAVTRPETDAAGSSAAGSDDPDADEEGGRDTRAPAAERRRAATTLVTIWRDLARDLVLVRLGEERRLRDPALLDDLRAAELSIDDVVAFLERLDRTAELIEGNVAPELAIDVLLLAWPRAASAA
jgi:hypothetical protein